MNHSPRKKNQISAAVPLGQGKGSKKKTTEEEEKRKEKKSLGKPKDRPISGDKKILGEYTVREFGARGSRGGGSEENKKRESSRATNAQRQ